MKRRCIVFLLASLNSHLADARLASSGKRPSEINIRRYTDCIADRISQSDDGISDAATIALAVAPNCRSLLYLVAKDFADALGGMTVDEEYAVQLRDEAATVTGLVLSYRRVSKDLKVK